MGVSRSGYYGYIKNLTSDNYKWLFRKNNPSIKDIKFKGDSEFIISVFNKHKSHGYRWLTHYIFNRYRVKYSEKYVFKILQYNHLRSHSKHYQWQKPEEEHETFKNMIYSNWDKIDKPLQVVVSDMTQFYVKESVT